MQERTGKAALARRTGSALLDRLLDTPRLAEVVPRLPPDTLHRLIDRCGLEACGAVLVLATPAQVAQVFDLDLWRAEAGGDAQFDAERFGEWIEVLVEQGADIAAALLARLDVDLVAAGLAQHVRVFDIATLEAYETTDGTAIPAVIEADGGLACDLAGRRLIARRPDAWDAIVDVLAALHEAHEGAFVRLMGACNALSHSRPEADGLDALLGRGAQSLFDLADAREQRREARGFASAADARAFLEASRRLSLQGGPPPTAPAPAPGLALLRVDDDSASRCALLRRALTVVRDRDPLLHEAREGELAWLANVLVAGATIDARPFTPQEASDAVAATCNLGLDCWPAAWRGSAPDERLVHHDAITAFQVGWTVLHDEACTQAADALLETLRGRPACDVETAAALADLQATLLRHWRAGTPWQARDALDVLAGLDQLAWITLLGLIAECPVLPATLQPATKPRLTVDPAAFTFIAERRELAAVDRFLETLPEVLRG